LSAVGGEGRSILSKEKREKGVITEYARKVGRGGTNSRDHRKEKKYGLIEKFLTEKIKPDLCSKKESGKRIGRVNHSYGRDPFLDWEYLPDMIKHLRKKRHSLLLYL